MGDIVDAASNGAILLDTITKQTGISLTPRRLRKQADAQKYFVDTVYDSVESKNLPTLYDKDGIIIMNESMKQLLSDSEKRRILDGLRQEYNIQNIISIAEEEVNKEHKKISSNIDTDWVTKFFNEARDVSIEEMQMIWGEILAGEFKEPGTYSLRTLNVLKNITSEEARLFTKMSAYVIEFQKKFMIDADADEKKIKFDELIELEICGLINLSPGRKITTSEKDISIIYGDLIGKILDNRVKCTVEYAFNRIYLLTQAGIDIYRLIKNKITAYDESYFINFMERKNIANDIYMGRIEIGVYKIKKNNSIDCFNNLVEPNYKKKYNY